MKNLSLLALFTLIYITSNTTIAIIGTNDIHGAAFPTSLVREDTGQKYNYGGLSFMGRLIQIIKSEFPESVMYLDAGDQFQGGIQSSKLISGGEIMNDFFNIMQVNGSAIGNHEFDFGPEFLFPYLQSRSTKNFAANLRTQNGDDNPLPEQISSKMFTLKNNIKIGVIGLATVETPFTTAGFSKDLFPPYEFLSYSSIVEAESKKLRKNGANAVLLLTHVGDACPIDLTYGIWTAQTHQQECSNDEMSKLIDSLQKGTIDGVVQGHRHRPVHHFRNGVPYMGNINGGYYFNVLYLTFNERRQVVESKIEGPIPVCQKIFENLGRCNYLTGEELEKAGKLVNWKFHNEDVYAHEEIEAVFEEKWLPKMKPYLEDIVVNQIQMMKEKENQSQLGNLVTNLFHQIVPDSHFALVNPGLFRNEWLPGLIQYQHVYNMFPFENLIQSFSIYGHELKDMLAIIQSGEKGFYQSWGLQMRVSFDGIKKQFISAQFIDGTEIKDDAQYKGVIIDFLLSGGDDFKDVMGKVYTARGVKEEGDLRQMLKEKLKEMKIIRAGSLIDPQKRRLIVN